MLPSLAFLETDAGSRNREDEPADPEKKQRSEKEEPAANDHVMDDDAMSVDPAYDWTNDAWQVLWHDRWYEAGNDFDRKCVLEYFVKVVGEENLANLNGVFKDLDKARSHWEELEVNWLCPLYLNDPVTEEPKPWKELYGRQPVDLAESRWDRLYKPGKGNFSSFGEFQFELDLHLSGVASMVRHAQTTGTLEYNLSSSAAGKVVSAMLQRFGPVKMLSAETYWGPRRIKLAVETLTGKLTYPDAKPKQGQEEEDFLERLMFDARMALGFRLPHFSSRNRTGPLQAEDFMQEKMLPSRFKNGVSPQAAQRWADQQAKKEMDQFQPSQEDEGPLLAKANARLPGELLGAVATGVCLMQRQNGEVFRELFSRPVPCCAGSHDKSAAFKIGAPDEQEAFEKKNGVYFFGSRSFSGTQGPDYLKVDTRLTLIHFGKWDKTRLLPLNGDIIHTEGLVWTSASPRWDWNGRSRVLFVLTVDPTALVANDKLKAGEFMAAIQPPNNQMYADLSLFETTLTGEERQIRTAILPVVILPPNAAWRVTHVENDRINDVHVREIHATYTRHASIGVVGRYF